MQYSQKVCYKQQEVEGCVPGVLLVNVVETHVFHVCVEYGSVPC